MGEMPVANRIVAAIILAAGSGSRFGGPGHKLEAKLGEKAVIQHTLDAVVDAAFNHVFLVQGCLDLAELVGDRPVTIVNSPNWEKGQAHSLQAGIAAARETECESVVIGLADQPGVPTSAWRSVGASAGLIVSATFDGKRRPPVKLHKSVWAELPTTGDEGAKALIASRPDLLKELPCVGDPSDIDTVEDLEKWK